MVEGHVQCRNACQTLQLLDYHTTVSAVWLPAQLLSAQLPPPPLRLSSSRSRTSCSSSSSSNNSSTSCSSLLRLYSCNHSSKPTLKSVLALLLQVTPFAAYWTQKLSFLCQCLCLSYTCTAQHHPRECWWLGSDTSALQLAN